MRRITAPRNVALLATFAFAALFAASSTATAGGYGDSWQRSGYGYNDAPDYRHGSSYRHSSSYGYDAPDYDCYEPPAYTYKTITTYEPKKVPYKKRYVTYDHCGEPIVSYRIAYRLVKVPVTKRVKVWH